MTKIYLATDHRGFELKEKIKVWLHEWGYEYQDFGALTFKSDDDYTDFIPEVAKKVSLDPENSKGIILGATGQGEAMLANRYKGVRAAVFYGPPFQFKRMSWRKWLLLGDDGGAGVMGTEELKIFMELIKLSREHNDSNVLSLGASFLGARAAKKIIKLWLETPFSEEERHKRRINKIDNV